ncbi:AhpA/YtjB family protein, partial [Pseudomonas aeruginosa]|uniref:AhpA/YtjB family protein n=2 Tax=Pseudomonas aeruginosa TaxID=287 RepID=UPI0031B7C2C0
GYLVSIASGNIKSQIFKGWKMARTKLKFRLHRAVIVLFCLALLVALMQGASWFSQNHQRQRNPQLEELARTLARQVTLNVAPLMRTDSPDEKR